MNGMRRRAPPSSLTARSQRFDAHSRDYRCLRMDARSPLANNTALWAHYFDQRRRGWLDLWPSSEGGIVDALSRAWVDSAAATIATSVALIVAPRIDAMYLLNAPAVTQFVEATKRSQDAGLPDQYR